MKFKTALFYNGSIAFYSVYLLDVNTYKAKLDEYPGLQKPPLLVELYKHGMNWNSDCDDNELIQELTAAIEFKGN
jgi:hypothetical protein